MINQNIRIRLKSFDHKILDRSSVDIMQTAKRTGAKVIGPIPMPSRIERVTVNKSPHVDKKSREQFEIRTHIRMMDIIEPTPQNSWCSMKLDLFKSLSILIGEILSPPGVIIISFFLSVIFKNSPSNSPMSPVDSHPIFLKPYLFLLHCSSNPTWRFLL